jgi:hypothetical protein
MAEHAETQWRSMISNYVDGQTFDWRDNAVRRWENAPQSAKRIGVIDPCLDLWEILWTNNDLGHISISTNVLPKISPCYLEALPARSFIIERHVNACLSVFAPVMNLTKTHGMMQVCTCTGEGEITISLTHAAHLLFFLLSI